MQPGKKGIEAVGYGDVEDIPAWTKGYRVIDITL